MNKLNNASLDESLRIAASEPELDATSILKLALFTQKLRSSERRMIRLIFEAEWKDETRQSIARAAGLTEKRVAEIIDAGLGDITPPAMWRKDGAPTVLDELQALHSKRMRFQERLQWWISRASEIGWADELIAEVTHLTQPQIEAIIASKVESR